MNKQQKFKQFLPLLLMLFYITVFPRLQKFLDPYILQFITWGGVFSPIIYMFMGLVVTVFAPLGLGPINILLQKGFGYYPSILYFFLYSFTGLMINFTLSKYFGKKILHYFFPQLHVSNTETPAVKILFDKFELAMVKGNIKSFIVFFGGGNEILSYLAGTTSLRFSKFVVICFFSSLINAFLFVTRNSAISSGNTFLYIGLEILFVFFTFISIGIVLLPDFNSIKIFFSDFVSMIKDYNKQKKHLKNIAKTNDISFSPHTHQKAVDDLEEEFGQKLNEMFKIKPKIDKK